MTDAYAHGYHSSVVSSHAARTASNSAAHLVPLLHDGMSILDVGCGPGTITTDLAALVPQGRVHGIDAATVVIERARQHAAERGITNVTFGVGDAYAIDALDNTYDVVTSHQMLHHLSDPVAALREFRRVVTADGIVALREVDYAAVFWYPLVPALDDWQRIMLAIGDEHGANFRAGRRLGSWALRAGFTDVAVSGSQRTYANPDETAWWATSWAERAVASSFATQAQEFGLATTDDLQRIADGWLEWARTPGAFFQLPHGEVIARA